MSLIPKAGSDSAARGLVLVAEDDAKERAVLARFLLSAGHKVLEAADGREAVDLALERAPDIVLLDIAMPEKNGIEVLKELAPGLPSAGFIMVTGNADEEIARSCLQLGAFDYISKPVDLEVLTRTINARLLSRRPPLI